MMLLTRLQAIRWLLGAIILSVLVFAWTRQGNILASIGRRGNLFQVHPVAGALAPDFKLESLSGAPIRLSELRGKTVLLNFWATWCTPCVLEMPQIQKRYAEYQGDFEVVAINAGESKTRVQNFVHDMNLSFIIGIDGDGSLQKLYQIRVYPTSLILDRDGKIRYVHTGGMSGEQLEDYLEQAGINQ